ncbi:LysR family transcriptional regulator [Actinobacillus vicugnae]|uniref:LysR family transcriptional regulator n=1 Tax=Actinobacillus vicugnae TaxID=2573093 RepID=UPI001240B296|nr:LysR family transcriptional regulator [Actinobacillus vicugnae]
MQKNIKHLIAFVQTAQSGSFTEAAVALDITPPAVSKSIAILEKSLGVRLFNRTTRSLSLTLEGEDFLKQIRPALEMLEHATDSLKASQNSPVGKVRISLLSAIGRHLILPLLPELQRLYPQIQLELDFNDRVIDFVKDGYDLVIRGGTIEESSMIARPLMTMTTTLVASPEYLAQFGEPKTMADLTQHRLIARRFLSGKLQLWHFQEQPFEPHQAVLTFSDPEAVLEATLQHLGIAEVADYLAKPYLTQKRLKPILPKIYEKNHFPLVLEYPHRSQLAPRVKAMVDFLLAKATDW